MSALSPTSVLCPVLIGRASELATLTRGLAEARGGSGQTILLAGEAGIGYEAGAWGQALVYAQRAGTRARALYAPRAAVEQFTRAGAGSARGAAPSAGCSRSLMVVLPQSSAIGYQPSGIRHPGAGVKKGPAIAVDNYANPSPQCPPALWRRASDNPSITDGR